MAVAANAGLVPVAGAPAALVAPAAYAVAPYASSYSAHAVNHAVAAPVITPAQYIAAAPVAPARFVAPSAPLVAAPAAPLVAPAGPVYSPGVVAARYLQSPYPYYL